ncbi:MAG: hypothetical protein ABFD86_15235 [Bryobacteraceae bacterium]
MGLLVAWMEDTTLINLTNIGLGLAVLIIFVAIASAIIYELISRAKRRPSFH